VTSYAVDNPPPARAIADGQNLKVRRLHDISDLYELWTLDILPVVGRKAGHLFETNPERFKRVPPEIADLLGQLTYRTGYDEHYLNMPQRLGLVRPLLGESDGSRHFDESSKFHRAAAGLRQAAVDYVQRSFSTGNASSETHSEMPKDHVCLPNCC